MERDELAQEASGIIRQRRQRAAMQWAERCFGDVLVHKPDERALRVLEEALELAQACGIRPTMIAKLVERVYQKPAGTPKEELAQVLFTGIIMAEALKEDADKLEREEFLRVLSLPVDHFTKRHATKIKEGITTWS